MGALPYQSNSIELTKIEATQAEAKSEGILAATSAEQCHSSEASGVRLSVAASLENSIEKNAAVWIALANH